MMLKVCDVTLEYQIVGGWPFIQNQINGGRNKWGTGKISINFLQNSNKIPTKYTIMGQSFLKEINGGGGWNKNPSVRKNEEHNKRKGAAVYSGLHSTRYFPHGIFGSFLPPKTTITFLLYSSS